MIDNSFRQILPKLASYPVRICILMGIKPTTLTIWGLVLGVVSAYFVANHHFYLAILFWWLGRFCDGIDGIVARATQTNSKFGAYLDIVCDMAAYSVMVLAFNRIFPALHLEWSLILTLYVLCITSALALGQHIEPEATTDGRGIKLALGLAEAFETGLVYTLILLFPTYTQNICWLWIVTLSITVIARSIFAYRHLDA